MFCYKKSIISPIIKLKVWRRDSGDNIICSCYICNKLVRPPEIIFNKLKKILKYNLNNYIYYAQKYAHCHYGHVISEYNGGSTTVNNLKIICETCNLKQGKKNMNSYKPDIEYMEIDIDNNSDNNIDNNIDNNSDNNIDNDPILMDTDFCVYQLSCGLKCKNKSIQGDSCYCHIHINN